MPAHISSYFVEELINWNHAINFHCNELDELTDKLAALSNIISEPLKGKIQQQQNALRSMVSRFSKLQVEIFGQEKLLQPTDGSLLKDNTIQDKYITGQNVLCLDVQAAEKDFIDFKFSCYQLIASLVIQQAQR